MIARLLTAAAVFWLAFDAGSYSVGARNALAIAVWWALAVGFVAGLLPFRQPSPYALVAGAFLLGLTVLTGLSVAWSASAEKSLGELDRTLLYAGVYALGVALSEPGHARRIADGIAIGIAAIAALALASRCFPDLAGDSELAQFLPASRNRLSYPIGYWNALAILTALAVPLLLRVAVAAGRPASRALGVALLPLLASTVYLTSSRGGVAVGAAGVGVFVLFTERRGAVLGALGAGAVGSAGAIAILVTRPELVNGPLSSPEASSQGRSAAALIALLCAGTGLAYAVAARYAPRAPVPGPTARRAFVVAAALLAVGAGVAADPLERFETFKRPPNELAQPGSDFVTAHLLSEGGSGRWQFWSAAVDEFESRPLLGRGAGSYEAWWAEHASFSYFVRDAHSLYLEVLGELGLLGFALLAGFVLTGLALAVRASTRGAGVDRVTAAALGAAFAGYFVGAGIDWMWELTVVSAVGITCLGLLAGLPDRPAPSPRPRGSRLVLSGVVTVLALGVIVLEGLPLLADRELAGSQAAFRRDELAEARERAERGRALTPWAGSAYLQLALVDEAAGDLQAARTQLAEAIERDGDDWRLWLVSARLATKAGAIADARRSLDRATALNPRSPLFAKGR